MDVIPITGGPLDTICYLVHDGTKGIVIDAPKGTAQEVQKKIDEIQITHFITTHGHWDHIADNAMMKRITGARHGCHELEREWLREPTWAPFPILPTIPDFFIADGDMIGCGSLCFSVLHTPGHTKGSICLFEKEKKVLFSGDALFRGTYGRTDLPEGNPLQMKLSLARLATLPPETKIYPGHGPATTIGKEKWMVTK
ncbi:MBL fold metallo-hydrolase [Candidatus Woesearchaeota archaeon]|nr:MBL fold metallo-hydrolase [Candidatus Woesearchaeota archaeon]